MNPKRKRAYLSIRQPRADVQRISAAVERPGIDPRTWAATGRTEADSDSSWFDPDRGWIVDVQINGGGFHGLSLPCRMVSPWPGLAGYGDYRPPGKDEEVVVVFPSGDPDEDPIAVGVVGNSDGGGAPTSIAGRSVLPEGVTVPMGPLAAPDCEFLKSPYSRVAEYEGEVHLKAKWVTLESGSPMAGIKLGSQTAMHPVARADILVSLLGQLIPAITAVITAGAAAPGTPLAGAPAWATAVNGMSSLISQLQSLGVVVD